MKGGVSEKGKNTWALVANMDAHICVRFKQVQTKHAVALFLLLSTVQIFTPKRGEQTNGINCDITDHIISSTGELTRKV